MCSVHKFPQCFFCAIQPTLQLVTNSCCHMLLVQVPVPWTVPSWFHEWWWHKSTTFWNSCPRCVAGYVCLKLTSYISSGYRNFTSILQHMGYHCLNHPTNTLPWLNHTSRCNKNHSWTYGSIKCWQEQHFPIFQSIHGVNHLWRMLAHKMFEKLGCCHITFHFRHKLLTEASNKEKRKPGYGCPAVGSAALVLV